MSTIFPENIQNQITNLVNLTVGNIAMIQKLTFEKEGDQWRICILTDNNSIFLEEQSQLLEAIQHLIRKIIHLKNPQDHSHFFFDIGYYNKNREYILSLQIPEFAHDTVLVQGKPVILIGLSGYERLYVHNLLSEVNGLQTTSLGANNNRKLLILPNSETGSSSIDESLIFNIDTIDNNIEIDMFKNSTNITNQPKN